jgi:putative DNA primase/helicase
MTFEQFAQSHGLNVDVVYRTERIKRCPTFLKPNKKNGAYFFDGAGGWVIAFDGDQQPHFYKSNDVISDDQKRKFLAERNKRDDRDRAKRLQAQKKAQEMISGATPCNHAYLERKGFASELGLVKDGNLVIPMRDVNDQVVGAQVITYKDNRFDKKFIYGSKSSGSFFRIGNKNSSKAILCEGYATGLSIKKAIDMIRLDACVIVCFSARNLITVSKLITSKKYIFADNDKVGELCAFESGLKYCKSPNDGEDANDLMRSSGIFAVARLLRGLCND